MPANTPALALPYPVPADTVDVPRDIQALATKLDTYSVGISPPVVVSALPATPPDGTQVIFIADNAKGILWHLRYSAGTVGTYKWHFIGGPPLQASVGGVESTAVTGAAVELATPLFVTVPLRGVYRVRYSATNIWNNGPGNNMLTCEIYLNNTLGMAATTNAVGQNLTSSQCLELTDLDLNAGPPYDVRAKYKVGSGTGFWQIRTLVVEPTRVG